MFGTYIRAIRPKPLCRFLLILVVGGAALFAELPSVKADQTEDQLKLIGLYAASDVYFKFTYIGVTADALSVKKYEAAQVESLMNDVDKAIGNALRLLEPVRTSPNLSAEDRQKLNQIVEIYGTLREETRRLIAFAKHRNQEDAQAFEKARTTAWAQLQQLLNLK